MTAEVGTPRVRAAATTTRRQRKPVVLLRPVPGDSVIHRLWAGSKLLLVAGIGVLMTFYPGWVPIGAVAVLVLTAARIARIPRGTLPSIPVWLWVLLFIGGLTATFGGGSPVIDLGSIEVGLGGLFNFLTSPRCRSSFSDSANGVVDDQRRRDRSGRSDIGAPAALVADPVDDWAVALCWRCGRSRC